MSANNWSICPKCKKKNNEINAKRIENVKKNYGVVSEDKYLELAEEAKKPIIIKETLREDYDIGVYEDGTFEVSYSCSCSVCGFKYSFKDQKIII